MDKRRHQHRLVAWYDENARALPWRVKGAHPQPYHVWLSEIMLQQTVVKTVIPYFDRFTRLWPSVFDLAAAPLDDVLRAWAGLGYYARARNLHACAEAVVAEHGGRFPESEGALRELPGIGPYTAAAIRAIAFERPATVMDGNVERVIARLFAIEAPLPGAKPLLREKAGGLTPLKRPGDYAQAMMDLGATICVPKRPLCGLCPLADHCLGYQRGDAGTLPRRAAKKRKPVRRGIAFIALRDDALLLRRRPDKGLLARMMEVPSTPWLEGELRENAAEATAPLSVAWRRVPGVVAHTFTHFHLELEVWCADVPVDANLLLAADAHRCRWVQRRDLADEALPSLMRKVIAHGLADEK